MRSLPDVLVLGAGGVLGEAWLFGVLGGIEDATGLKLRDCESFLGTSAGAIVACALASGRAPRRPARAARGTARRSGATGDSHRAPRDAGIGSLGSLALIAALRTGRAGLKTGRPVVPVALRAGAPAGALARSLLLRMIPPGTEAHAALRRRVRRWEAHFDGRLRIVAVDRADGRRVVFGSPGAPDSTVADAVAASCAIPGVFAPVEIHGREYVDGGVWSLTNLDAAPVGRDTRVLCLNPLAGLEGGTPAAALRAFARSAAAVEEQALRARGAEVTTIAPDGPSAAAIGADPMDGDRRDRVLAAGHRQGLRIGARAG